MTGQNPRQGKAILPGTIALAKEFCEYGVAPNRVVRSSKLEAMILRVGRLEHLGDLLESLSVFGCGGVILQS